MRDWLERVVSDWLKRGGEGLVREGEGRDWLERGGEGLVREGW